MAHRFLTPWQAHLSIAANLYCAMLRACRLQRLMQRPQAKHFSSSMCNSSSFEIAP
jgi:hypothetical protein